MVDFETDTSFNKKLVTMIEAGFSLTEPYLDKPSTNILLLNYL